MKRLIVAVLLTIVLVSCTAPSDTAPVETPAVTETPAQAPPNATAVTPLTPTEEHDHEHFGELVSDSVYQAILAAATQLPLKVEYVDPETGIKYGTQLEGNFVKVYAFKDGELNELYAVDKQTEWVDVNAKIGNQLVIMEKNPTTQMGRVFLLDVESKEQTDILNEQLYHGPMTSEYVVRDNKVYFTYDKDNQNIAIVSYDVETKKLETAVADAFDLKLYKDEMYYLKLVNRQVGLYKLTVTGEEVEVVEPGLNLYDYYFVDGKLDLLTFVTQGDTFYYLRISDFHGGGPMAEFIFVQPNIMGDDVMIGTAEHQTMIQHDGHIHALPEVTQVGKDTYFTYGAGDVYYFQTVNNQATTYYSIKKADLLGAFSE